MSKTASEPYDMTGVKNHEPLVKSVELKHDCFDDTYALSRFCNNVDNLLDALNKGEDVECGHGESWGEADPFILREIINAIYAAMEAE